VRDGHARAVSRTSKARPRSGRFQILTNNAQFIVRDRGDRRPVADRRPTLTLRRPGVRSVRPAQQGRDPRDVPEDQRRVNDSRSLVRQLEAEGPGVAPFNWGLFFNADSRFPELAGLPAPSSARSTRCWSAS
jgi:phosphate transport system permease protein